MILGRIGRRQIWLVLAAIAFVVWFVIEQPTQAAHIVSNIGAFLAKAASGFSNFVASL